MKTQSNPLLIVLFISFLFSSSSLAQGGWGKAKLEFWNGEKKEVLVKKTTTLQLPYFLKYKTGKKGKVQRCKPREVALLDFENGKRYVGSKLTLDLSTVDLQDMSTFIKPKLEDTTLLLRQLVRGTYNLYYFKDMDAKEHFFFQGPGQDIHELIYRVYYEKNPSTFNGGNLLLKKDYQFRKELSKHAKACMPLAEKSFTLEYKLSELTQYVEALNTCKN